MSPSDRHSQLTLLQYRNAVTGAQERVVASPYDGPERVHDDEWEIEYQRKHAGEEWSTYATDYSMEKPEVNHDCD